MTRKQILDLDADEAIERLRSAFNEDGFQFRVGSWTVNVGKDSVGKTMTGLDALKQAR